MVPSAWAAKIRSVTPITEPGTAGQRAEWKIDLKGQFDNAYDPDEIRLDAEVVLPDGETVTVPGFFRVDYDLQLVDGQEQMQKRPPGQWRLRFRPEAEGEYRLTLRAEDAGGGDQAQEMVFVVGPAEVPYRGGIRVSKQNPRVFAYANGDAYIPLGLNLCTPPGSRKKGPPERVFVYDAWFDAMQSNGINFGRLWLAPSFNLLNLWDKPGQIDQEAAARVDHVMEGAERAGVAMMMCIDVHLNLMVKKYFWKSNPMNSANGGPLGEPTDFWTDAEAQRLFRNRLRYLVARWGDSPAVFAWEFWNEVNLTDEYAKHESDVSDWHLAMTQYLREIDAYDRMVTTSTASAKGPAPGVESLAELDLQQIHHYGSDDSATTIRRLNDWRPAVPDRPVPQLIAEFGPSPKDERFMEESQGTFVKNALWAGIFAPTPATPMVWWWNGYVEKHGLWHLWAPVAKFAADLPVLEGEARPLQDFELAMAEPTSATSSVPVTVAGGWALWDPAPPNEPTRLSVDPNGQVQGASTLSMLLHGQGHHRKLHNPVTIEADWREPGSFTLHVEKVSRSGDAILHIELDGQEVLERTVPAWPALKDPQPDPVDLTIDVPAGPHTLRVINTGKDWANVSYRLDGPLLNDRPRVDVFGSIYDHARVGQPAVVGWLHHREYTWPNVLDGRSIEAMPDLSLTLHGLPAGTYRPEYWDTDTGERTSAAEVRVTEGQVQLTVPGFNTDRAFKLIRVQ